MATTQYPFFVPVAKMLYSLLLYSFLFYNNSGQVSHKFSYKSRQQNWKTSKPLIKAGAYCFAYLLGTYRFADIITEISNILSASESNVKKPLVIKWINTRYFNFF